MPALVAGIHALLTSDEKGVDGRDEPGHDDLNGPGLIDREKR
ncbi:hypothetical protein [Rhodopseudomonas palustris]|nr:hypothetical protein [Rhodopseudomonas palustris]